MYDWEYDIIELVRSLGMKIDSLEKEMDGFPEGFMVISKKRNGKKIEYYHRTYTSGKYSQKYLSPLTEKKLIDLLITKRERMPEITEELHKLKESYNSLLPIARRILSEINIRKVNYPPFYSENHLHPEHLRHKTVRGEIVRSISERTIADTLFRYDLDYKYEKALQLGNAVIHPDFTIINPINGKTYYLEFLGLNNEEYNKSWDFKLARFAENNISKENYLIVTVPEDLNNLDHIIKQNFTLERYKRILS